MNVCKQVLPKGLKGSLFDCMGFQVLLEKIIDHFTSPTYIEDVNRAKADFFGGFISLDKDTQKFHLRMSQFLDWYAFDYRLKETGLTPIESAMENKGLLDMNTNNHIPHFFESLMHPHHSLFEFMKINRQGFLLKDMISEEKKQVHSPVTILSFGRDEYFEARLISVNGICQLSGGICFHPVEAKPFILKAIKKVKLLGEYEHKELMRGLAKMRFKCDQFPHLQVQHVYFSSR